MLAFGEYGLVADEGAYVSSNQLEAARIAMSRPTHPERIASLYGNDGEDALNSSDALFEFRRE